MPNIPSLEEMLAAGVHFGHKTSRWHPKMAPFIFTARGGVHIVNLEETQKQLEETLSYLKSIAARGGVVLFVGSKKQAKGFVKQYADQVGMPYVNERWLGGTLTNFGQIQKLVKHYKKLKDQQDKGELGKYTKKERLMISREIADMERKIFGIKDMDKKPDALFVIDTKTEKTAVQEANHQNIPVVAVCDTNVNPDKMKFIVPANDDAVKSIEMMLRLAAEAIAEGKAEGTKVVNAAEKPAEKKAPVEADDVALTETSKKVVEELDLKLHDQILSEKQDEEKQK